MEYTIIFSSDGIQDLMEEVDKAISEGWVPLGGVAIDAGVDWTHLYQAMTREPREVGE